MKICVINFYVVCNNKLIKLLIFGNVIRRRNDLCLIVNLYTSHSFTRTYLILPPTQYYTGRRYTSKKAKKEQFFLICFRFEKKTTKVGKVKNLKIWIYER